MRRVTILLVCTFLLAGIVPATNTAAASDWNYDEWIEAHQVKVNVKKIYTYKEEILTIETVYIGAELEDKLGISIVKKKHEFPVKAEMLMESYEQISLSEEEVIELLEGETIEKDAGSKITVLTRAADPPRWWESYPYPQWTWVKTDSGYEISDPINLAWENTEQSAVKAALDALDDENNWVDDDVLETWGAIREFVYQKDKGWTLGDNYATDSVGWDGREHMRLWTIYTEAVVAAAHEDSPVPHKAISFEREENRIRDIFDGSPDWNFHHDEWLDNVVSDPSNPPYSDGYASVITINNPPNMPSNPSPANHATGVPTNATLTWEGGDPNPGDTVTYDVYFGIGSHPPLVSPNQSQPTYDPGTLSNTIYSWRIVATDNHGASTEGPLWDFTPIGADIVICGIAGEVNCDPRSGVTIELYKDGTRIDGTTSDENGNYTLPVPETGDYDVVASKTGFRDETQTIEVTGLGQEYTLDFRAETGLIPKAAKMSYVLICVNHWLYPVPPCGLSMSKVLLVVNAWLYPT